MKTVQQATIDTMRVLAAEAIDKAKSGHPGGSLSAVELLITLYFNEMNVTEENVDHVHRDKFVLSKGHASPVLYSVLAAKGFFPESELMKFRNLNANLQGHPNMRLVRGVDMSTGSLGQGLSVAVGMSLANKLDQNDFRTYVLCGDGESEEGRGKREQDDAETGRFQCYVRSCLHRYGEGIL